MYKYFIPFFIVSFSPCIWADYYKFWGGISMFFGTLLEYKLTRISYIWFDSTKFLCPFCPRVGIWPVLMVLSVKCGVMAMGLELGEWVYNSNKKDEIYCQTQIKKHWKFETFVLFFSSAWQSTKEIANNFIVFFYTQFENNGVMIKMWFEMYTVFTNSFFLCWIDREACTHTHMHVHSHTHTLCNHPHTQMHTVLHLRKHVNTIKMQ